MGVSINIQRGLNERHAFTPNLPLSFSQIARELNLQGWHQAHTDLIVSRDGLKKLLQSMLETIFVDESWYLETYPDVRRAIKSGSIVNATTHYRMFGYFEGRLPSLMGFRTTSYLEKNPDLAQSLGDKGNDALVEHFVRHGYQEGREFR